MMLEKACLAVEKAATGGGVYPEVMFEIAHHWYEMYKRHSPPGTLAREEGPCRPPAQPPVSRAMPNHPLVSQPSIPISQPPPNVASTSAGFHIGQVGPPGGFQMPTFPAVYSLIHGFPGNPNQLPPQIPLQMYVGPPPQHVLSGLQVPTSLNQGAGVAGQFPGMPAPGMGAIPGLQIFPNTSDSGPRFNLAGGPLFQLTLPGMGAPNNMAPLLPNPPQNLQPGVVLLAHPPPSASPLQPHGPSPSSPSNHPSINSNALICQRYLMPAYRVGMIALETLGRRVSEDRPQTKFARNPSYSEDVKWLLGVAKKLGLQCLQNFLMCVMATVVSPFILQVTLTSN